MCYLFYLRVESFVENTLAHQINRYCSDCWKADLTVQLRKGLEAWVAELVLL